MPSINHWMIYFGLIGRGNQMKKIKDERLALKNMKNIRTAVIVQTIGIVAMLFYEAITQGIQEMTGNPLWFVFILTMVVFMWFQLTISVDIYDNATKQK